MKNILCFGDSNVYGFNPESGSRYNKLSRWSGILKENLKDKFNIIEAGCNNRTCFVDNPNEEELTGYKAIKKYLSKDIDIVILAIGINDLQKFYTVDSKNIEKGIKNLIKIIEDYKKDTTIILAIPSKIKTNILDSYFKELFDEESIKKSAVLIRVYKKVANDLNLKFIELDKISETSDIDGLHYDIENHKKIAEFITKYLINL